MLRVFLVFLSFRLSVALPAALACPSLCSLIAWCAPWSTRGDRSSVSVADKRLAPRSMCPIAGFTCILLTRMSTTVRRVGEGRFFFVSPPLSSFPFILFCLALCTVIVCNCTKGVLALCVQCFVGASVLRRSLERCRRAQRAGCRCDGRKHGGNCTETGSFLHLPPRSSSRGEHVACRRTVPSPCAGGGGKTRPRKRQMQGKNVICNDLCAKSACISKKKPTFAVELSYYYCQPHHAKKITSFLHGAAHLGGGAHGGRPPQAQ